MTKVVRRELGRKARSLGVGGEVTPDCVLARPVAFPALQQAAADSPVGGDVVFDALCHVLDDDRPAFVSTARTTA